MSAQRRRPATTSAAHTRDNTIPRVFKNATTPTDFSGGAAGNQCIYDNYNPLDDLGWPPSQRDTVYPFYVEAADDFKLPGDPANDCLLSEVTFAVAWFNGPGGETPFTCWGGVNITIYENAADFCGPGFLNGPAGKPFCELPQGHIEYCPGGVVCEIKTPLFDGSPLDGECITTAIWEIIVFGLEEAQCRLQNDHTYWIAIAPEQQFAICGQTAIVLSANPPVDQPAQKYELCSGALAWTEVAGNADDCPPVTSPAGTYRDLSIGIAAIDRGAGCVWDLANEDDIVDAADLAVLLGAWGNPYGAVELANLLGAWGPCD